MIDDDFERVHGDNWRMLNQTMAEARRAFADMPPDELAAVIVEAVATVRKANAPKAG